MPSTSTPNSEHSPAARILRASGELCSLALATLLAWFYAGGASYWEYLASALVAILISLWFAYSIAVRKCPIRFDLVSFALGGLILLALFQLLPLPSNVVRTIAPARYDWHATYLPLVIERLPGETSAVARADFIPLSVEPDATRTHVARLIAVLAIYLAARNWLANRASIRRLIWAVFVNGLLLSVFALGQYFSTKGNAIYWSVETGVGAAYGPFICRNHFPDYIAFSLGAAVSLLLTKSPDKKSEKEIPLGDQTPWEKIFDTFTGAFKFLEKPLAITAALGIGLMSVSIPFSLSRGGVLAILGALLATILLARWGAKSSNPRIGWGLTLAIGFGLCLTLWFGLDPIRERIARSSGSTDVDDRTPLWIAGVNASSKSPLVGTGAGTFLRVEPFGRTTESPNTVFEHAHNEFVEAFVEGGAIRVGFTLLLAFGAPISIARSYRRLRGRTAGPILLGVFFALAVSAFHAVTDFAIHLPAVAALAAIATGFANTAAHDSGFEIVRRRIRKRIAVTELAPPASEPEPLPVQLSLVPPPKRESPFGFVFLGILVFAVGISTLDSRSRYRSEACRVAAEAMRSRATPEATERRIAYQELRTRIAPGESAAHFDLAQAYLDRANSERTEAGIPRAAVERDVLPALRSLRRARELCPLYPEVHARLGVYCQYFESGEPALAHLRRAMVLLPNDPELLFACGLEELRSGNRADAIENWKKSLELSPRQLPAILRSAGTLLTPGELRDGVLPDEPDVQRRAADALYPDAAKFAAERRVFLLRAAGAADRVGLKHWQFEAISAACDELEQYETATEMWRRAAAANQFSEPIRQSAARWFEKQELYTEAVPHLEWIQNRHPNEPQVAERLKVALHGAELQRVLSK